MKSTEEKPYRDVEILYSKGDTFPEISKSEIEKRSGKVSMAFMQNNMAVEESTANSKPVEKEICKGIDGLERKQELLTNNNTRSFPCTFPNPHLTQKRVSRYLKRLATSCEYKRNLGALCKREFYKKFITKDTTKMKRKEKDVFSGGEGDFTQTFMSTNENRIPNAVVEIFKQKDSRLSQQFTNITTCIQITSPEDKTYRDLQILYCKGDAFPEFSKSEIEKRVGKVNVASLQTDITKSKDTAYQTSEGNEICSITFDSPSKQETFINENTRSYSCSDRNPHFNEKCLKRLSTSCEYKRNLGALCEEEPNKKINSQDKTLSTEEEMEIFVGGEENFSQTAMSPKQCSIPDGVVDNIKNDDSRVAQQNSSLRPWTQIISPKEKSDREIQMLFCKGDAFPEFSKSEIEKRVGRVSMTSMETFITMGESTTDKTFVEKEMCSVTDDVTTKQETLDSKNPRSVSCPPSSPQSTQKQISKCLKRLTTLCENKWNLRGLHEVESNKQFNEKDESRCVKDEKEIFIGGEGDCTQRVTSPNWDYMPDNKKEQNITGGFISKYENKSTDGKAVSSMEVKGETVMENASLRGKTTDSDPHFDALQSSERQTDLSIKDIYKVRLSKFQEISDDTDSGTSAQKSLQDVRAEEAKLFVELLKELHYKNFGKKSELNLKRKYKIHRRHKVSFDSDSASSAISDVTKSLPPGNEKTKNVVLSTSYSAEYCNQRRVQCIKDSRPRYYRGKKY